MLDFAITAPLSRLWNQISLYGAGEVEGMEGGDGPTWMTQQPFETQGAAAEDFSADQEGAASDLGTHLLLEEHTSGFHASQAGCLPFSLRCSAALSLFDVICLAVNQHLLDSFLGHEEKSCVYKRLDPLRRPQGHYNGP